MKLESQNFAPINSTMTDHMTDAHMIYIDCTHMTEDVVPSVLFQLKDRVVPNSNILKHVQVLIGGVLREVTGNRGLSVPVQTDKQTLEV